MQEEWQQLKELPESVANFEKMTHISYMKCGMLLLSVLTSAMLFITTYHLFNGSKLLKLKEARPGWIAQFPSKVQSNLNQRSYKSKNSSGAQSETLINTSNIHSYGGQEKLWDKFLKGCVNSSKGNTRPLLQRNCRDALCTNYLSESDLKIFHQCQKNSTRRFKKFLGHQSNSNVSRRLRSCLSETDTRGVLVTGSCRFMSGGG